jgi:hypothetical protein
MVHAKAKELQEWALILKESRLLVTVIENKLCSKG